MLCQPIRCIKSRNVIIGQTSVLIFITEPICRLKNLKRFMIVLNACTQLDETPRQVFLILNNHKLPILSNSGNLLYSDQLRKGQTYSLIYGDNEPHVLILNDVCPTSYIKPKE